MQNIKRRSFITRSSLALAGLSLGPARVLSATPGLRSLQIVVPAPTGTQPDLIARWLIEPLARRAGVPGVVLNRPGAGGAIAADAVLAAPADTGTLLLGGLDHVAYSHLHSNRRALDPLRDFVPVGAVNRDTWVLAATADMSQRKFTTIYDAALWRPALSYASTGEGTTSHLLAARLCKALGIEGRHIPYKDSYLSDLVAGRVDFVLAPTPSVLGPIQAGRLQAVVSLTDERLPQLSQVQSIREAGWPDQVFYGGLFLFAPAALADQAQALNGWLRETLRLPEIDARYRSAGIEPTPLSPEEVRQSIGDRLRTVDAMRMAVFGQSR